MSVLPALAAQVRRPLVALGVLAMALALPGGTQAAALVD